MDPWEVIVRMIQAQGTEFVFGIGDTFVNMYAEKVPGIRAINVRSEGSAPFMAMAYSRLSGNIGVCTASPGPGVAELVPGALEAYYGCSPLVMPCLSAPQKTKGMGEFQECDQVGMMKPVTKWSAQIPRLDSIPWYLKRAFSTAINGQPGPVYLDLPADVAGAGPFAEYWGLDEVNTEEPEYQKAKKFRSGGDPVSISEAAELMQKASLPLVVAGSGVILSAAFAEFKEFLELLGIPFVTTPGGRGVLSEDHPLALGGVGLYRTKLGKKMYSETDLLISIGSRNESFQTHGWADKPDNAKFIQIDVEPFEIDRNWNPDVAIVGDAKIVLKQLIDCIKGKFKPVDFMEMTRTLELIELKKEYEQEVKEECMNESIPLSAKRIVYELNSVFGKDTILVNENGGQDTWSYCFPYYKVQNTLGSIPVAEQTCMGMGVVGAIAAKLTRPEKNVVCVTGDGAFQMYMKELPTAAQYKVGCTWVIINNSSLGWIKWLQEKYGTADTTTFTVQPDFVQIAHANQCFGRRVEKTSEVRPALEAALKANKDGIPAVLDFVVPELDMSHFERAE